MARGLAAEWPAAAENAGAAILAGTADAGGAEARRDSRYRDGGAGDRGAADAGASAGAGFDSRRGRADRRAERESLHRAFADAAGHVPEGLADYVLDGGPARVGIESTVLSLAGAPTLLRPGVIPADRN